MIPNSILSHYSQLTQLGVRMQEFLILFLQVSSRSKWIEICLHGLSDYSAALNIEVFHI